MRSNDEVRALIRERSTLPPEQVEAVLAKRFTALPKRLVNALERWPLERERVLDVGCQYGHCLVHFGEGSVGIDNVEEHVEFCRSYGLDARLEDVDAGLPGIEDASFDTVWISDIVEHLDAPRLLLRRVAPKLKPDGRLLLYVNLLPRSRVARRLFAGKGFFDADVHHYQFTLDTVRYLLRRAGYAIEEVVPNGLPRKLEPLAPLAAPLAPVVYVAARRDARLEAEAEAAERRNKPAA